MKIIRHPLFMRPQSDDAMEQWLDRELRRLPDRPAPATLMPRVMQAIAARKALPWWRKSYAHWPFVARITFLIGSSGLGMLLFYAVWGLLSGVSLAGLQAEFPTLGVGWDSVFSLLETLGSAARLLIVTTGSWLMWAAAAVAGVSYLTTIGLGTVCWRLMARRE